MRTRYSVLAVLAGLWVSVATLPQAPAAAPPEGWQGLAAREEIRPAFTFDPAGEPDGKGCLVITSDGREGLDGHWAKTFPVRGGLCYRFAALLRTENVPTPRRSVLVRLLWQNDQGRQVLHDEPGARSYRDSPLPVAEPEYPTDRATDASGWTEVSDIYCAPLKATRAVVELHLRWAPSARVEWAEVSLNEVPAPPSRGPARTTSISSAAPTPTRRRTG